MWVIERSASQARQPITPRRVRRNDGLSKLRNPELVKVTRVKQSGGVVNLPQPQRVQIGVWIGSLLGMMNTAGLGYGAPPEVSGRRGSIPKVTAREYNGPPFQKIRPGFPTRTPVDGAAPATKDLCGL